MANIKKLIDPNAFKGANNTWTTASSSSYTDSDENPISPNIENARSSVSLSPAFNPSTSGQPDVVKDIYAPQLRDISSRLSEAYNPPELGIGGTLRHVLGAIVSNRNPQLGSIVSGDFGRQREIAGLTKQYGLTEDAINQERAMQNQGIENRLHNAQANYFENRANAVENPPPKPTTEEQDISDLMGQVNPKTGKKYTHYEASMKRTQDVADTKPDNSKGGTLTDLSIGGKNHKVLVDTKTGAIVKDLGESKLPVPPVAASEHDMEPVMAYDKSGRAHIVPKSEALAPSSGYTNVIKASDKDLNDAKTHAVVLNDMQSKLNDVVSSADALDQGISQRAIISKVLSHAEPGMWNDLVKGGMLSGATDKTKNYIQSVLSLKESALGLPKEITGGSRTSEIQGNALFQTLPSGSSVDSKYALGQAKKFQANIDRLKNRVPAVRGMEEVQPHPSLGGTGQSSGGFTHF